MPLSSLLDFLLHAHFNHTIGWNLVEPRAARGVAGHKGEYPALKACKQWQFAHNQHSLPRHKKRNLQRFKIDFGHVLRQLLKHLGHIGLLLETPGGRSEEHTSELQSLMRNSYA